MKQYCNHLLLCPHCNNIQPDIVDDYVKPYQLGTLSKVKTACEHCGNKFTIEKFDSSSFLVERV